MRERDNPQTLGAAPRHQAKAEANLSEENTQKSKSVSAKNNQPST
jgi:hypothetical protein